MTDDQPVSLLAHLSATLDALGQRLTDLEAAVEHLDVYAL